MGQLKNLIIKHKYISSLILLGIIMLSILFIIFFKYTHTVSYVDIINNVTSAKIEDVYKNKYEEELSIELKYKIVLYNKDNEIVETLIVNYSKDIISSRGTFENSSLDDFCSKLEKKYKIDYDKLLARKPGKDYFKDLLKCTSGSIINNKTNKSKYLTDTNINALKFASDIKILKRQDFDLKYRITLFDDTENISYTFDISSDNKVYCNKWELDGNVVIIINDLIKDLKI